MPLIKRETIVEGIMAQVRREGRKSGYRIPGERELAGQFACSRDTVRAALRQLHGRGLLARVQGSGTFLIEDPSADPTSHSSPRTSTRMIAFIVVETRYPFLYQSILQGLRKNLDDKSWTISYWHFDSRQNHDLTTMMAGYDALVVTGDFLSVDLAALAATGKPMVVIGETGDALLASMKAPCLQISSNYRLAYMQATEHLLEQGYQRPAIFLSSNHEAYQMRYAGFCDALRNRGLAPSEYLHLVVDSAEHHGSLGSPRVEKAVEKLFERMDEFDSLVTPSWQEAIGVAMKRGLPLLERFGLVGEVTGSDPLITSMSITAITSDMNLVARTVSDCLVEKLRTGWRQHEGVALVPQLMVRESSRRLPHTLTGT